MLCASEAFRRPSSPRCPAARPPSSPTRSCCCPRWTSSRWSRPGSRRRALALLRASLGEDLAAAVADARAVLAEPEEAALAGLVDVEQVTFVGTGWSVGLAEEAALKLRESAQFWTESYPAMEYRHGPIAIAAPGRATWAFGPVPDGLRRAGRGDRRPLRAPRPRPAGRAGPGAPALPRQGPPGRRRPGPPATPHPFGGPRTAMTDTGGARGGRGGRPRWHPDQGGPRRPRPRCRRAASSSRRRPTSPHASETTVASVVGRLVAAIAGYATRRLRCRGARPGRRGDGDRRPVREPRMAGPPDPLSGRGGRRRPGGRRPRRARGAGGRGPARGGGRGSGRPLPTPRHRHRRRTDGRRPRAERRWLGRRARSRQRRSERSAVSRAGASAASRSSPPLRRSGANTPLVRANSSTPRPSRNASSRATRLRWPCGSEPCRPWPERSTRR